MKKIESSILIKSAVDRVFQYAVDWQRWEDWFEGVADFRLVSGTRHGEGARYKYKARIMGFNAVLETEIHDYSENSGWTGIGVKGLPHRTQWVFEPVGDSTRFTYGLEYKFPIPLIGDLLCSLFVDRQWQQIIDASLKNFKAMLETNSGR